MNYKILYLIPIIIFLVYIWYLVNIEHLFQREGFENQNAVIGDMGSLFTSNIGISSNLHAEDYYKRILAADDIKIDSNATSNLNFEILDEIVPNKNDLLRKIQFDNVHTDFVPQQSNIDLRQIYNMGENSLNMQSEQIRSNNITSLTSIDDPISDAYLPYSQNIVKDIKTPQQNNNEYVVISMFKELLDRNPTPSEVEKYANQLATNETDVGLLRVNLLNSVEYRRNVKLQTNDVSADMEYSLAKEDLISYVTKLFFNEKGKEPARGIILPLRDIYIYLQNNEYLFRAFLIHENYSKFEKDVLSVRLMTKNNLSELFDKYFILYDLRLKANDIKHHDILERKGGIVDDVVAISSGGGTAIEDANIDQRDSAILFEKIMRQK